METYQVNSSGVVCVLGVVRMIWGGRKRGVAELGRLSKKTRFGGMVTIEGGPKEG